MTIKACNVVYSLIHLQTQLKEILQVIHGCGATHVKHNAKSTEECEKPCWLWNLLRERILLCLYLSSDRTSYLVKVDKGVRKSQAGECPDQVGGHHS